MSRGPAEDSSSATQSEIDAMEAAITALQAQRALLGDAVADRAIAVLDQERLRLSESLAPATAHDLLEGELRTVTVMFADISGFTALAEQMDPEQVRSLMNACFDELVPPVTRHGGTIDKFIGDEIMALFGAPRAHENDPERALRAALDMMQRLQRFNERRGTALGLHFGINTGSVIAGGLGDQAHRQYSVMGDAVNLAARLQDVSERGEIFVGPETWRQASPLFDFEPLAPLRLKGKSEPVAVYKLLGAKSRPGATRGLAGLSCALLERDAELEQLRQSQAALAAGSGGAVVVLAEAGLGKSRLLADAGPAAALRRVQAGGLSHAQDQPYHLVSALLRALVGLQEGPAAPHAYDTLRDFALDHLGAEALEVWPALAHLLQLHEGLKSDPVADEAMAGVDSPSLPGLYAVALRRLLEACAAKRPLLLCLEDLHWADPSSVQMLSRALAAVASTPLHLVLISRPEEHAAGWQLIDEARRQLQGRSAELALKPLSETAARQMLSQLLATPQLPQSVHDLVLRKAEGNPLFIEEMARMLIERGGVVRDDDGRWVAGPALDALQVPDKLQGLLLARVDRLPAELRHALRLASVIGRRFPQRLLQSVLGQAGPPMQALEAQGLLQPTAVDGEPGWFFCQSLVHEAAYASLLQSDRRHLHRQVADALLRLYDGSESAWAEPLAHHLERGEDWAGALPWLRLCADSAWERFALREAQALYQRALACAERLASGVPDEWAMCMRLADCMARTGAPPSRTLQTLERCLRLAPDTAARAQAHLQAGQTLHIFMRSDLPAAEGHYRQALELLEPLGPSALYGSVLAHLGYLQRYLGRPQQAAQMLERALQLASAEADPGPIAVPAQQAEALVYLSGAYLDLGRVDDARQAGQQALRLANAIGSIEMRGRAHSFLADVCLEHGPDEEAIEHLRQMRRFAREYGVTVLGAFGAMGLASFAERQGDQPGAIAALEEAEQAWRDAGLTHRALWPCVERARLLLMAGALPAAERAFAAARSVGSGQAGWTELLIARALALAGQVEAGCAAVEPALRGADSAQQRAQWLQQLRATGLKAAPIFAQHLQHLADQASGSSG